MEAEYGEREEGSRLMSQKKGVCRPGIGIDMRVK